MELRYQLLSSLKLLRSPRSFSASYRNIHTQVCHVHGALLGLKSQVRKQLEPTNTTIKRTKEPVTSRHCFHLCSLMPFVSLFCQDHAKTNTKTKLHSNTLQIHCFAFRLMARRCFLHAHSELLCCSLPQFRPQTWAGRSTHLFGPNSRVYWWPGGITLT